MICEDHDVFLRAIDERRIVILSFYSHEDDAVLTRRCIPWDFGPSSFARDRSDRYHLEDLESDAGIRHPLPLRPENVVSIELTDEIFDPAEVIHWREITWWYPRDWGACSGTPRAA